MARRISTQWISAGVTADGVYDFVDCHLAPSAFCDELLGFGFSSDDCDTMRCALVEKCVGEDFVVTREWFQRAWSAVAGAPLVIDLTGGSNDDTATYLPPTTPTSPYDSLCGAVQHTPFLDRWKRAVIAAASGDGATIHALQLDVHELSRKLSPLTSRTLKPRAPSLCLAGGQTLAEVAAAHSQWSLLGTLTASIDIEAHRRHWLVCPSGTDADGPLPSREEAAGERAAAALRADFRGTLQQRSDGLCYFGGEIGPPSSATFTLPPPPAGATLAKWDERLRYFGTRPQYTAEVAKHLDAWSRVQPRGLASLYTPAGGDCLLCAAMVCMVGAVCFYLPLHLKRILLTI